MLLPSCPRGSRVTISWGLDSTVSTARVCCISATLLGHECRVLCGLETYFLVGVPEQCRGGDCAASLVVIGRVCPRTPMGSNRQSLTISMVRHKILLYSIADQKIHSAPARSYFLPTDFLLAPSLPGCLTRRGFLVLCMLQGGDVMPRQHSPQNSVCLRGT